MKQILFILAFLFFLENVFAQESRQKLSIHYSNVSAAAIIDSICLKYGYNFSYNAELPFVTHIKSIKCDCEIAELLTQLTRDEDVGFNIIGKQIVIFPLINLAEKESVIKEIFSFIVVEGRVCDRKTRQPLCYASVTISKKALSTVAGTNGRFSIKLPANVAGDTLFFSCIGYRTGFHIIRNVGADTIDVMLDEEATILKPVIIKPVLALELVQDMLDHTEQNYRNKNTMCSGFYRETTRDGDEYISICEAVLDIAKAPYQSIFLNDQARIFRGRKSENVKRLKNMTYKLEGGVYNCLMLDLVKETPSFLQAEDFNLYNYTFSRNTYQNGHMLIVIAFDQKDNVQSPLFKGELFIDRNSKALVAATFQLSPKGMPYVNNLFVKKQPRRMKIKTLGAEYTVQYRNFNGRYHLEYARCELKLKAKSDRLFVNSVFTTISELVVTNIDTTNNSRFKRSEIAKANQIMDDLLQHNNESFWGSYNTLKPDEPLIEAIRKLKD